MNIRKRAVPIALLALLVFVAVTFVALGQSGGGNDLAWWTTGGGGGASSGGAYAVTDTGGQPVASHDPSDDGLRYSMKDGFWQVFSAQRTIYVPVILRGGP